MVSWTLVNRFLVRREELIMVTAGGAGKDASSSEVEEKLMAELVREIAAEVGVRIGLGIEIGFMLE